MNYYRIAGLTVGYEPKYPKLTQRSEAYRVYDPPKVDFVFRPDYDYLRGEVEKNEGSTMDIAEYACVGSEFNTLLLACHGLMLHSSCVVLDGRAYCFTASSGTGKSTHTSLWLKAFADRGPFILNDDKPALIQSGGEFYACGTPFSGKHDISRNVHVPLKAIAYIVRSETNHIERLDPFTAFKYLLEQTIRVESDVLMDKLFETAEQLLDKVPYYLLHCNMEDDAPLVSYGVMSGG